MSCRTNQILVAGTGVEINRSCEQQQTSGRVHDGLRLKWHREVKVPTSDTGQATDLSDNGFRTMVTAFKHMRVVNSVVTVLTKDRSIHRMSTCVHDNSAIIQRRGLRIVLNPGGHTAENNWHVSQTGRNARMQQKNCN